MKATFMCPLCGNQDGAAFIKPKVRQPARWKSKWNVNCRSCEGHMPERDYIYLLAEFLETDVPSLLLEADELLEDAGLLNKDSWNRSGLDPYDRDRPAGEGLEYTLEPADLRVRQWGFWRAALPRRADLCAWLGGVKLVRKYELMLLPPWAYGEQGRPAVAWPILASGEPINVVRRFLDDKEPRYKGLVGRGHGLWPDPALMPAHKTVLLVAGMRDACWARAAGIHAFTTTGGVAHFPRVLDWCPGRTFAICFDADERVQANRLAKRLRRVGAADVAVFAPSGGAKDIAELGERSGLKAIRQLLEA